MRHGVLLAVFAASCAASDDNPPASGEDSTAAAPVTSSSSSGETIPDPVTATTTGGDTTAAADDATTTGVDPATACNGHALLCDRPLPAVVFAATHNAFAATDDGFIAVAANQTHGIARQLEDGIRAMLWDVTIDADETKLCHGNCAFGSIPHVQALTILRDFMEAHPRDVVVLIYQDDAPASAVEADFAEVGLDDDVYVHAEGAAWPTLGELIDAGTTLVVTAEFGGPPPAWYHHVWDLAWDTPYEFTDPRQFDCSLNRGALGNDLLLINHWLSTDLGLPASHLAPTANEGAMIQSRVTQCLRAAGRSPTFIAVDFYEVGDLLAVVDALNRGP